MKQNFSIKYIYLLIILISFFSAKAQEDNSLIIKENESIILEKFRNLLTSNSDADKKLINNEISDLLYKTLQLEQSFDYQFSSLKNLGQITSNNQKLRIYTWNLVYEDGSYEYFGFIQHKESKKSTKLIRLYDASGDINSPENAVLTDKNWFGALYYEIIDVEAKGKTYYTLLAWDGNNLFSNKKLIDVLYFSKTGQAKFGYPIFRRNGRAAKRVVFEYGKTAGMALRYDKNLEAIVFDRLVPSKPTFEGNYQFYVPDVTTDGLVLDKNNKWNFVEDIQSKNIKGQGLKNRKTEKGTK